ncbi:MAG: hypothetical protein V3V35_00080 [Dehalococcoidia bacterium]
MTPRVIDADGHVSERIDWDRALSPNLRDLAPRPWPQETGDARWPAGSGVCHAVVVGFELMC